MYCMYYTSSLYYLPYTLGVVYCPRPCRTLARWAYCVVLGSRSLWIRASRQRADTQPCRAAICKGKGSGLRVQSKELRVRGAWTRVRGTGLWVQGRG